MTAGIRPLDCATLNLMDHSSLLRSAASTIRLLLRGPLDDTTRDIAGFVAESCDAAAKGESLPLKAPGAPAPIELPPRHPHTPRETRGNAGYGYRWTPGRTDQVLHPPELKILARIYDARAIEGLTLQAIADSLNRDRIPSQRGGLWNLQKVKIQLDRIYEDPTLRAAISPFRITPGAD